MKECGKNALELISGLACGFVYSDYALIPFDMGKVMVQAKEGSRVEGKLVVIDNADILLDDDIRKFISSDGKSQYLIIGRNPRNLFAARENLFELVSSRAGEQTVFSIKPYL